MEQINFKQSLALLWITIMNQSQSSKDVIRNVPILFERLGFKDEFKICSYEEIYYAMTTPTILHRFPKRMSSYVTESLKVISGRFDENPANIFSDRKDIIDNLILFKGIGQHKANIALYIYDCVMLHKILSIRELQCNICVEELIEELAYIYSLVDI